METEHPISILIVDDNLSLTRTTALILSHKGYTASIAKNGPLAIEKVKEQPFDVILMDIKMPLMNGVETYKQIKKIRPEAIVMMMTAYAMEDLVQEALQEGAYGVIYKPLDIEKMINLIEETQKTQRGALILVVDDDPGTCITLKHILSTKGYQVGTAYTGEEAIATAHKVTHDIIFIDVKLPTINGLETYLAIREINSQAVVILLTAYRQEVAELVQEAIRHSAYSCLYKPLDIEALLELVYEICQRKQKGT